MPPEATLTTPAPAPSQQPPAVPASPSITPAAVNPPASQPPQQPAAAATPPVVATPANLVSGDQPPVVPDKFRINKADGSIDHDATLQKVLGSYIHLEKRFGSGDVPPETETGYKLDYAAFPEGIKVDPEGEKLFLKRMHGSGLTNKQVQAVINEYGAVIKQGLELQKKQSADQVTATLKSVAEELLTSWGANFDANKSAAVRGFNHLADETDKVELKNIGIDAKATYRILMKVLAKVGAGITEDTAVNAEGGGGLNETLAELMKSEAYINADHKDHKATVDKVTALYEKKYPNK